MKVLLVVLTFCFSIRVDATDTNSTNNSVSDDQKRAGGVTLPDGTFIPNSPKKKEDPSNSQLASENVIQDRSSKVTYDYLRGVYERQKTLLPYLPQSERIYYRDTMNLLDAYFKAFEEGNEEKIRLCNLKVKERANDLLMNKPVVALSYNEILKKVVSSDVRFAMYSNSDQFYLAVGEDPFRTLATLSAENIVGIVEAFNKSMKWAEQCYNDKMEVNKPMGSFGGLKIEFESEEGGRFSKYNINIKGDMGNDRLISEQNVWMTLTDFACLIDKIRNAPQMYEERIKRKQNADKLK